MKVSREYLRRIIKEEIEKAIEEELDPTYGAIDVEDTAEYKQAIQMAMQDPADKKSLLDQLKQWMRSVGLLAVPGQESVTGMQETGASGNLLQTALSAAEKDPRMKKGLLDLFKNFVASNQG